MTRRVVVVVGGEVDGYGPAAAAGVPEGAIVVAADSGLDAALALGLRVDHLVGDLDSVSATALAAAEAAGTHVFRHPADKDATDSELAVAFALGLLPFEGGELLVLGGGGGRLDHLLADALALAAPVLAHVEVTARFGPATVTVVRPARPRSVRGRVGEQVSLLPLHGRARGVTTTGLRWLLADADLVPGTTRAVSNELVATEATVEITEGVVLVVQPGTAAAPVTPRTTPYDPTPVDPTA
ncbi:thiamine diphosphokinase [Aquihabitans sp. G128]|uniref:thiamine diphosphokinase n=1 Tax=Aquihabitans sp. G128 TaxID=2849779 RepID=UPI001C227551|nr:thiamine diphosphokinase [Aquihabitans sp. G128]QXC61814.1 thiamine diphosphokinase [Aquihabitans sp. G128]